MAYVYTGTTTNLCGDFAGAGDLNCTQAGYQVTLLDENVDPWGLDGSGSNMGTVGLGCETQPLKGDQPPPRLSAPPPVRSLRLRRLRQVVARATPTVAGRVPCPAQGF